MRKISTIKFVPRDPIKPIFAINLSPAIHTIIQEIENEEERLRLIRSALKIDPKRIIALNKIISGKDKNGTIVVIFDYIYDKIIPKYTVPYNEDGVFKFKIFEFDFNQDINVEKILTQI